ncbi:hypothetical protein GCM10009830_44740 [Glycomyces endophyticus]|uniref:Uncharacterized protein n=1 Tax=Glycomyces endophyticus TaxID=480996 RepID=A0ABP4TQR9_9ACTN
MQPHDDTGTMFRQARPDTTPTEAPLDLDTIMRGGYRARRRHRAVIGAAATSGAAVLAAVIALSAGVFDPAAESAPPHEYPAGAGFDFDPATAAYPRNSWADEWDDVPGALDAAAEAAFGDLVVNGGFVDARDLAGERPSDGQIQAAMDEFGIGYEEALSELGHLNQPLQFSRRDWPAAGGQVYLRGYVADEGDDRPEEQAFEIAAVQPGGWTAEPGPTGDVAFPQHLISDEASWTDDAPAFTSEALDDGRTLMVADHGCALEAAVVYPNGSALRSSWDLDCEGQGHEMSVEDLTAAMLAMPQFTYDTGELAPADDLLEIPPAPEWDEDWETAAEADMQASVDAALDVIDTAHPGAELADAGASQNPDTGLRMYIGSLYLPYPYADGYDVSATVTYHLPGGWLPGLPPEGESPEPYLVSCGGPGDDKDDTCEETEVDGRTVATRDFGIVESHSYWVLVYDPAGWAVEFSLNYEGEIEGLALDDLVALTASLPAPVYDPAEYGQD